MESFVVSARKYRPAVFSHVLGQDHITTTLKNAVQNNHLAQAFLFCGPRGVGKTTCARILAKTINCQQVTADTEPCNTCASCTSFNHGSSMNVYELDAASNNSVEDIRALVEQVRYPPPTGQYKVYIIDEVHMLSNNAFNAFLKTLEEPPSYAIFILATTEKHKIIPTILSRCQLFDFHRIQPQDSVQQLKHIAEQEGIAYEEEALHLISQKADGAMRDALSVFDLIVTFAAGQKVTYQATRAHLHILDHAYYFRLTEACLQGDAGAALLLYDEILKAGFDGHHFITGLSEHFRNLMVSHKATTLPLLATAERIKEQYQAQAAQAGLDFLFKALQITQQCDLHYKNNNNQRLHVELALIELAYMQGSPQPTTDGGAPQQRTPPEPLPSTGPKPTSKDIAADSAPQPKPPVTPTAAPVPSPSPSTDAQQLRHEERAASTIPHPKPTASAAPVASSSTGPKPPSKDTAADQRAQPSAKPSTLLTTTRLPRLDQLKERVAKKETVSSAQAPQPTAEPSSLTLAALQPHWQAYAQQLKAAGKMSEYSVLSQAIRLEGTTIVVPLVNAVQQDILGSIKEELIAFLRKHLQHTAMDIKGVVTQPTKSNKPYTAQEKFNYLAAKQPALHLLQKQLALEVRE
ncbi:MAG: DNA polymerase III subunit gamma/tau [Roseivirga sp.]